MLASGSTRIRAAGAVPLSPWVDLSLLGGTIESRESADPIVSRAALKAGADQYLGGADPRDPCASRLWNDLSGLPPVWIHVGDAKVLLDDDLRLDGAAARAGVPCEVHFWDGMVHVFQSNVACSRPRPRRWTVPAGFCARP